jgi:uncharacterized protein
VLLPLGLWLILGSQRLPPTRPAPSRQARGLIWGLSLAIGTIGGIYGVGGGSMLAPILLAVGYSAYEVAPATLAATFLSSIGGIVTYQVLQATHGGTIALDWASERSSAPAASWAATSARGSKADYPNAPCGACSD